MLLLLNLGAASLGAAQYWLAPPDYTPYTTDPCASSSTVPLRFSTTLVQQLITSNLCSPNDPTVHLIFKPGVYETEALYLKGGANRVLILAGEDPNNRPVLRYQVPTGVGSSFAGPESETWLLQWPAYTEPPLAEFKAYDLVLDGNWPAWAAAHTHASPANSFVHESGRQRGFKLGALYAGARTGHVARVQVRNCGALGVTPWPWWIGPGTEGFPLLVHAAEFATNRWVVEDCEVRDFHSVHGGYCTAIMVTTAPPDDEYSGEEPVATVRRCQVYGNNLEIGLGTANSAGVLFRDNVVVGVDRGFSCDTAPITYVDLVNNVFLDVNLLANIGGPVWGPGQSSFFNLAVVSNAVRLESVPLYQNYRSYQWQAVTYGSFTNWMPVSSATLAAGRWATGFCAGLLVGGADQIRFQTNRFTTRHVSGFFEPDPTNTALARWRPFWAPTYSPVTGQECYHGTYSVTNLLVSSHAMDFTNSATLNDPTAERYALDQWPVNEFVVAGRIERVVPNYLGQSNQLSEVWEIQVSQPEVVNGQVRVKARSVAHRPNGETANWYQPTLYLDVRAGPNTNVVGLAGSWTNGIAWFSYATNGLPGRDEIVIYSSGSPDTAPRTVVEYFHGQTVRFERIADVADDRRLNPGLLRLRRSDPSGTLTVTVAPLTTNHLSGLRLALPGSSGDYHLYTNHVDATNTWYYKAPEADGTWNLVFPANQREILARVVPVNTAYNRHTLESEMAVFQLRTNGAYAVAPPGPWTTPGPTNHSVAVTLWDGPKYWMYDLWAYYYFDCGSGSGTGASGEQDGEPVPVLVEGDEPIAEALAPAAEMAAVDTAAGGPAPPGWIQTRIGEWIAVEADAGAAAGETIEPLEAAPLEGLDGGGGEVGLTTTCYLYGYGNTAYGINNQASGGTPIPVIAGSAFFNNSSYPQLPQPYFQLAGSWQAPQYGTFRAVSTPWNYGVMRDVDGNNNLVGEIDSQACYVEGTNVYFLQRFQINSVGSAAYALSDGGYAAGWGRSNNVARPARWDVIDLNTAPRDLDPANPTRPGYAYGVNTSGVTVGKVQRTKDGVTVWRAFRWTGSLGELALPPDGATTNLLNNTANDVTASAHALGATDAVFVRDTERRETRACVWWAGTNGPALLGTVGWTDPNPWRRPGRSEALGAVELGATNKLLVVGTGWITPSGYPRAYRQRVDRDEEGETYPGLLLNLNDAHLTVVPSGWTLVTGEDVNAREWVVGSATDASGQTRGYVLVPQTE